MQALPLPMRRHAGQAGQARATRQGDQQSFHLVVGMLGQRNVVHLGPLVWHRFGQGRITCFSGSFFWALTRSMACLHLSYGQRHIQLLAQRSAMRFKRVSRILQAVVNVHRPHLPRPAAGAGPQQSRGVGPTAEGHRKRKARAEVSQGLFDGQQRC